MCSSLWRHTSEWHSVWTLSCWSLLRQWLLHRALSAPQELLQSGFQDPEVGHVGDGHPLCYPGQGSHAGVLSSPHSVPQRWDDQDPAADRARVGEALERMRWCFLDKTPIVNSFVSETDQIPSDIFLLCAWGISSVRLASRFHSFPKSRMSKYQHRGGTKQSAGMNGMFQARLSSRLGINDPSDRSSK